MRVAFDSRPAAAEPGSGRYAQRLLQALRDTAGEQDEIHETHRPRGVDIFHSPWLQGAMLHSPCPMIVTIHDLAAHKRPSERLRCGGMHLRLRHLAVQRAIHVIVPTEDTAREAVAELGLERERVVVIAEVPDPVIAEVPGPATPDSATSPSERSAARARAWTWEDVARETWEVYRRALAHPHRSCVTVPRRRVGLSRPRAARAQQGLSSAES